MESKLIALILSLLAVSSVIISQTNLNGELSQFESWKAQHNIKYDSFENTYREKIFLKNLAKITLHNSSPSKTFEMGVNQFSALTQEEFEQQYLGFIAPENIQVASDVATPIVGDVDWTTQGAVTGVKNQGQCGSCWAFSTTGAVEGLSKLAYGTLQSFSEQQLVDCSGSYGNMACNGGLMDNAFKYIRDKGIVLESEYPYKAVKQTCSRDGGAFKISGFTDVKTCNDLTNAVQGRPVSVAVDATNWSTYKSGVFNNCATRLNHGVLLVGTVGGAWRIKNSWGTSWGESGFIRLASGNTCGVCNVASYPNK